MLDARTAVEILDVMDSTAFDSIVKAIGLRTKQGSVCGPHTFTPRWTILRRKSLTSLLQAACRSPARNLDLILLNLHIIAFRYIGEYPKIRVRHAVRA